MIAVFFLRRLWGQGNQRPIEGQDASPEKSSQQEASTQAFLGAHGISESSIETHDGALLTTNVDDYLPQDAFISPEDELRKLELEHRLKLRRLVLYALIIPMAIIPIWLMVLLTVPAFNKDAKISETMQIAYLTAVASDFIGLYYIITRDLFPNGGRFNKRK